MFPVTRGLTAAAVAGGVLLSMASPAIAADVPQPKASPQASVVCSVVPIDATIRSTPGGQTVGTMHSGDRFRVDNFNDNVWVIGAGYRLDTGYLIAAGYTLRSNLICNL
ncbi:hypothetical protein SHL15_9158 [Streptomyces hygroscopicus subsp. limoneus]|nr:hypothetical protein SHL15_9158 [Streptomyces hygroscopicus subsp. limoneus]